MFDRWHEEGGTGKDLATLRAMEPLWGEKSESICALETKGLDLRPVLPFNSLFNLAQ